MDRTAYRTVDVGGLSVFYREAGPKDAPTLLLLHGFPSSSRMWQPLLDRLAGRFHLVAPAFLSRPGQQDIQTDLFYDYRTNVASYPAWQDWLRKRQPPLQVVWGRYDPSSRSRRLRHTAGTCQTPRCTSWTPATSLSTSSPT